MIAAMSTARNNYIQFEPDASLVRRAWHGYLGTLLLVHVAEIAGSANGPGQPLGEELALLRLALATSATLIAVVLAFGPMSEEHSSRLIAATPWGSGRRASRCALAYVTAQTAGGLTGALLVFWSFHAAPATELCGWWTIAVGCCVSRACRGSAKPGWPSSWRRQCDRSFSGGSIEMCAIAPPPSR